MPVKKSKTKKSTKKTVKKTPKQPGVFISFEGSEGSGKTTQISRLATRLEDHNHDAVVTREPGGTPIGEEVRHLLKHAPAGSDMFPETELLLFAASRAQLVRQLILPSLNDGKFILCDRFLDSTTVYQGAARQMSDDPIQLINTFAAGNLMPHLTIVLDVPPEVGLHRIKFRVNDIPDRMEQENIEFYQRVRQGYLVLAKSLPDRLLVIDATQERKDIENQIWHEINKRFF